MTPQMSTQLRKESTMNLNHLLADSRSRCVYVCVSGGGEHILSAQKNTGK